MKKIPPQNCEFYGKTITRIHFSDPGELPPRTKIITDDQTVEANLLIQGKLQNNLYIDPLPKSKTESVHVYVQQPMEEQYFSYIEKLSNGDYRNAFEDKNVTTTEREKIIRNKLAELKRTNYQISHCRPEHGIVSINTMKRNAIRNGVKPKDWLIDTTHQASFRTPEQIAKVGTIFKTEPYKPRTEDDLLNNKMLRETFTFDKTIYQKELCDIAEQRLKLIETLRPIDKYTKIKN